MKLTTAYVRQPSSIMEQGLLTHLDSTEVSPDRAFGQWRDYRDILADYADVVELEPLDELPDSVFVEDTAFTYDDLAVRTELLGEKRQQEQPSAIARLESDGFRVVDLPYGAALEGGDVLKFGGQVWVGLTTRTNDVGVAGLREILEPFGVPVHGVPCERALHLKSCLTMLPSGVAITHPDYAPELEAFGEVKTVPEFLGSQIVILDDETILMSASAPKSAELLRSEGFAVLTTPISEFEKMEGSVTCMSIRIRR